MSQRYVVKGKIGAGGLGEVYLATDTQLDRDVALKRVKPPETGSIEGLHQDLIREARTLSSLQHPHIVTIYDVGQDEHGPFVVMEFLKGETLDQVIERGAMTVDDFKEVVVQTLEGMIAAQELGLVHRDLKPGNLMVIWLASGKFQIKILDFGLAKFSRTASRQTEDQEAGIMGSIFFMAPEQFERLPLDARTDMYSLGCIFYQILTTKYPFDGQTGPEVMVSHLQHQVRHLVEARPDLPVWLADWVMWLISREMDDRPTDARQALDYFQAQQSGTKNPSPAAPVQLAPHVKIVGRGSGPGGITQSITTKITQRVPNRHTQKITSTGTQKLQGTAATSRSSRPSAKKVPKKKSGLLWLMILLFAALGGAAIWWFNQPQKPVTIDAQARLNTLLEAPDPAPTPANLELLLNTLLSNSDADSPRAAAALDRMKGSQVAAALAAALPKASGAARMRTVDLIATHPSKAATRHLIKIVREESGPIRPAAFQALTKTAAAADIPDLLKILPRLEDPTGKEGLRQTITQLLESEKDTSARIRILTDELASVSNDVRPELLRLLGESAHPNANRALADEITVLGDRRMAALQALPAWSMPSPSIAQALTSEAAVSPSDRVVLLNALCMVVPRVAAWNGAERTSALRDVQELVTATETRTAFTSALGNIASPEAAAYAAELAQQPDWAEGAATAATQIAALMENVTPLIQGSTPIDAAKAVILTTEKDAYYTSTSRYITNWKRKDTKVAWDLKIDAPTTVSIKVLQSTSFPGLRRFHVHFGSGSHEATVKPTESNETFTYVESGSFTIPRPGYWRLWLQSSKMEEAQPLFNLREIVATIN